VNKELCTPKSQDGRFLMETIKFEKSQVGKGGLPPLGLDGIPPGRGKPPFPTCQVIQLEPLLPQFIF
jgi:hypothetical protein